MIRRTTAIDQVLLILGVLTIVGGIVAAIGLWPNWRIEQAGLGPTMKIAAVSAFASTFVSGVLMIAFGTVIRLLDEMRGILASSSAERRVSEQTLTAVAGEPPELQDGNRYGDLAIERGADGTYVVEGRSFKNLGSAQAYVDLVNRQRK